MSKRKPKKTTRPETALVAPVPEGRERQRVLCFVAVFLVVNLVIPLRWYFGWGDDERFCWRMFSSNSLQRVSLSMRETVDGAERRVPAETVMQPAWNEFLHKYRQPAAFRGMLERHCALTEAGSARMLRTGTWSDGSTIEAEVFRYTTGE